MSSRYSSRQGEGLGIGTYDTSRASRGKPKRTTKDIYSFTHRFPNPLFSLARLRHIAAIAMTCLISLANMQPVASDPAKTNIQIDYLGMTSNLMSGLFGTSPAMLGKYLDAREQTAIGEAIWHGNPKQAIKLALQFTNDKAIGNIPVLGQLYAMGQLGKQLGDQAWIKFGPGEFDKIYGKYFNDFSASELAQPPDDFVKAMIAQGSATVLFAWIDRQTGKNNSPDAKIRIVWDMIRKKRNLEILCNERDLNGNNCNPGQLIRLEMNEASAIATAAQAVEQDRQKQRRAWLKEKARKLKTWKEKQKKDRAEFEAFLCNVWLGRIIDDKDQALPRPSDDDVEDLCGEKPRHPDYPANADSSNTGTDQTAANNGAQSTADMPGETPNSGQSGPVAWSISASGDGDETVFAIWITNISDKPLSALSLKISAAGTFSSGGIASGSGRAASSLPAGRSRVYKAVTVGDVRGIIGVISSNGKVLGSFTRLAAHKNPMVVETLKPFYEGKFVSKDGGRVQDGKIMKDIRFYRDSNLVVYLNISNGQIKGALWTQEIAVNAKEYPVYRDYFPLIKGDVDKKTGKISATIYTKSSGIWDASHSAETSFPLYGNLSGRLSNGILKGKWNGWNGNNDWKIVGSGTWTAEPCNKQTCKTLGYRIKTE